MRIKIRPKVALVTALFMTVFIALLTLFSIEYNNRLLGIANKNEAGSIYSSVKGPLETYLNTWYNIKRERKKIEYYRDKMKLASGYSKNYYNQRIKNSYDYIRNLNKDLNENSLKMRGLIDKDVRDYQVMFTSPEGKLLYHSSSFLQNTIGKFLDMKAEAHTSQKSIIDNHEQAQGLNFEPVTRLFTQAASGYLSYTRPVYAWPREAQMAQNMIYLQEHVTSAELQRKLNKTAKDATRSLELLDAYVKNWHEQKAQETPDKDHIFREYFFKRDDTIKPVYEAFINIRDQRKELWQELKQEVTTYYDTRHEKITAQIEKNKLRKEDYSHLTNEAGYLMIDKNKALNSIRFFASSYRNIMTPFADSWQKQRSWYQAYTTDIAQNSRQMLSELFGAVAEIQLFLYDIITEQKQATNKMIDLSLSVFLRAFFLVFFLAGFLVRDIKKLASTAEQVREGDLDARFQVKARDEMHDLAETFNDMLVGLREKEVLRHEIETASVIQRNLLPRNTRALEPHFDFAYEYRAMTGVGGDYIDMFAISENRVALVVADVSNHGVGPGLVMTMMRSSLRAMARDNADPAGLVKSLNAILYDETPGNIFVTLFLAYIDYNSGDVEYVSCGHNPPYVISNGSIRELEAGGMALGSMGSVIFDSMVEVHRFELKKGEYLFQYTDGLTEAWNENEEMLSEERVEKLLFKLSKEDTLTAKKIILNVMRYLEKFTGLTLPEDGPTELTDDVALAAITIKEK